MKTEKWISNKLRDPRLIKRMTCFTFEACGSPGVPDLYCVSREAPPFWLELKIVPGQFCQIPFRPFQPQWLDAHANAGGRAFILVLIHASASLVLFRAERVRTLALRRIAAAEAWKIGEISLSGPDTWEKVEDMCLGHPRGKLQQS